MSPANGQSDVFLCYHKDDSPSVEALAQRLQSAGLRPWLDEWHIVPGTSWMPVIAQALNSCSCCAVCVGPSGLGPWQHSQMERAIQRLVDEPHRNYRAIPVILPGGRWSEYAVLADFIRTTAYVEFVSSIDDARAFQRLTAAIRGVPPEVMGTPPPDQLPYRGLRPFTVEDQHLFFGREALVQRLIDRLKPPLDALPSSRFVGIIGVSGSGKSSLAQAGLIAELKQNGLPGSNAWWYASLTPGAEPLRRLAEAMQTALSAKGRSFAAEELQQHLQLKPHVLDHIIDWGMADRPVNERLVLLVDQLEEVFTLCTSDLERRQFLAALSYAARNTCGRSIIIVTLRSDFYGHCAAYPQLAALLAERHFLVAPLSRGELRRAVEQPALAARYAFEPNLVDRIVDDAGDAVALPLVQEALLQLWQRRDKQRRRLGFEAYAAIGGVQKALELHAERVYTGLGREEQAICRTMLIELVEIGTGDSFTRRYVARSALSAHVADRGQVARLIDRLAGPEARLLTVGEGQRDDPQVWLAHESLITAWDRLSRWIEPGRRELLLLRELETATRRWQQRGRTADYLIGGQQLAEYASLLEHPALSANGRSFLQACLTLQRRQRRQRRLSIGALAGLLLLLTGLGWYTYERDRMQRQAIAAAESPWIRPQGPSFSDPVTDLQYVPGQSPGFYVATNDLGVGRSSDGLSWAFTPAAQLGLPTGPPAGGDPAKIVSIITHIAVDLVNSQHLLATAEEHGVYRSDDGAGNWAPSGEGINPALLTRGVFNGLSLHGELAVLGLYVKGGADPVDRQGRIFLSADGGTHWRDVTPAETGQIYTVALDPLGETIFLGTARGVFSAPAPQNESAQPTWEQRPGLPPTLAIGFGDDNSSVYLATDGEGTGTLKTYCWARTTRQLTLLSTTDDQALVLAPRPEALYLLQKNGTVLQMLLGDDRCSLRKLTVLRAHPGFAFTLLAVPQGEQTRLLLGHELGVLEYREQLRAR